MHFVVVGVVDVISTVRVHHEDHLLRHWQVFTRFHVLIFVVVVVGDVDHGHVHFLVWGEFDLLGANC